ncbi:tyrosine-type recombinase/integrase [Thalassotalea ponticola]|uniref:tyrosine-type recombinase/integrase n=1 Tax=Thalassotalea ponticola TaxID=1523392 RepID=UPI0025B35167|nr:tyrosine-type recombinase/integrase [Thalassotalea ponticola]MDN3652314.1 tyrosine-type recombinase/integrase [Thalassotalea ponticola]
MPKTISELDLTNFLHEPSKQSLSDGFGLTFIKGTERGSATAYFRKQCQGHPIKLKLGQYPAISLATLVSQRDDMSQSIAQGITPKAARDRALTLHTHKTFRDVALLCFERRVKPHHKRPQNVLSILENHILPKIGHLPIEHIGVYHVDDIMAHVKGESYDDKVLREIKRPIKFAMQYGFPVSGVAIITLTSKDYVLTQKRGGRVIGTDEIKPFLTDIINANQGRENVLILYVLITLLIRKNELIWAKKAEFDFKNQLWHLPAKRTYQGKTVFTSKTGVSIAIPLPDVVVSWLEELFSMHPNSEFVIPARKKSASPVVSESTFNKAFAPIFSKYHTNMHGTRHTGSMLMQYLGISEYVRELCLNHRHGGDYSHYLQLEPRKIAHEKLAKYIADIINKILLEKTKESL